MENPKIYTYPKNLTLVHAKDNFPVVVSGSISPVGSFLGALSKVSLSELNDHAIRVVLERAGVRFANGKVTPEDLDKLDALVTGNIFGLERGTARISAYNLGFEHLNAENVEKMCISGLKAINDVCLLLTHPKSQVTRAVASGVESLSRIPHSLEIRGKALQQLEGMDKRGRPKMAKTFYGHLELDSKFALLANLKLRDEVMQGLTCSMAGMIMGKTAEKIAHFWKISKNEADDFALISHFNAGAAGLLGVYDSVMTTIPGTNLIYHEGIKTDKIKLDDIRLNNKFVFADENFPNPVITPNNACPLNDGAAAVYIVNSSLAQDYDATLGNILAYSPVAVDPSVMGIGPSPAIQQLVEKTSKDLDIGLDDIGMININEAFAVQVLACKKDLKERYGLDIEGKLNLDGGSIAVGHPVGGTLVRLVLETLLMLKDRNMRYGIASACVGGGQGGAVLLENPEYDASRPSEIRPAMQRLESQTGKDPYLLLRRLMVYGNT
ncbi:MAG: thiolase family protein [Candidatus Aminicenantes bacterium]|nr:thiolase family protein [Candidatus Aminicenantes bacterium]